MSGNEQYVRERCDEIEIRKSPPGSKKAWMLALWCNDPMSVLFSGDSEGEVWEQAADKLKSDEFAEAYLDGESPY